MILEPGVIHGTLQKSTLLNHKQEVAGAALAHAPKAVHA